MTALVIADTHQGRLTAHTARTVAAACALGEMVHVVVAARNATQAAAEAATLSRVDKVLVIEADVLEYAFAEPMAKLIVTLAANYAVLLAAATSSGKDFMPRVAALLDVMQVSEVVEILDDRTFRRPIYAGNAIQTVRSNQSPTVLTVRTSAFEPVASTGNATIERMDMQVSAAATVVVSEEEMDQSRPALATARVVVSGGRGLGSKANFDRLILPLADRLGAAIGASRAAVDAGYAANEWQVGQTGQAVAPDLYIACGISGAIQHVAGMQSAKVIVAINTDPGAPIFALADFGLVADLNAALPELTAALEH